ncbi:hypothetical protein NMY22_g11888 [Coprinellus aureogranulatus]|nr:hypothetical protein NMY22_g11888 [Coprinellus aureogranulatus]
MGLREEGDHRKGRRVRRVGEDGWGKAAAASSTSASHGERRTSILDAIRMHTKRLRLNDPTQGLPWPSPTSPSARSVTALQTSPHARDVETEGFKSSTPSPRAQNAHHQKTSGLFVDFFPNPRYVSASLFPVVAGSDPPSHRNSPLARRTPRDGFGVEAEMLAFGRSKMNTETGYSEVAGLLQDLKRFAVRARPPPSYRLDIATHGRCELLLRFLPRIHRFLLNFFFYSLSFLGFAQVVQFAFHDTFGPPSFKYGHLSGTSILLLVLMLSTRLPDRFGLTNLSPSLANGFRTGGRKEEAKAKEDEVQKRESGSGSEEGEQETRDSKKRTKTQVGTEAAGEDTPVVTVSLAVQHTDSIKEIGQPDVNPPISSIIQSRSCSVDAQGENSPTMPTPPVLTPPVPTTFSFGESPKDDGRGTPPTVPTGRSAPLREWTQRTTLPPLHRRSTRSGCTDRSSVRQVGDGCWRSSGLDGVGES